MDQRLEPVVLETDRYRIEGNLSLPREGYRSRLSDFVNQREREFFSIQSATVRSLDGTGDSEKMEFMLVARGHIRLIIPQDGG